MIYLQYFKERRAHAAGDANHVAVARPHVLAHTAHNRVNKVLHPCVYVQPSQGSSLKDAIDLARCPGVHAEV